MASPPPTGNYYPLAATSQKTDNASGPPPPPYPGQQPPPMALPYTQQAPAPTLQYPPPPQQQQTPYYPPQQQYNPPMQPQPGIYNPQYPQPPSVQAYAVPVPMSQQGVWLDGQACFIPPIPGHYLQIERATFGPIDVTLQTQMLVQRQGGCSLSIAGGDSHNFVQHFGDPQPYVQKRFMLAYIMRPMGPGGAMPQLAQPIKTFAPAGPKPRVPPPNCLAHFLLLIGCLIPPVFGNGVWFICCSLSYLIWCCGGDYCAEPCACCPGTPCGPGQERLEYERLYPHPSGPIGSLGMRGGGGGGGRPIRNYRRNDDPYDNRGYDNIGDGGAVYGGDGGGGGDNGGSGGGGDSGGSGGGGGDGGGGGGGDGGGGGGGGGDGN